MAEGGDDAPAPAQPPCLDSLASSWTRTALALCLASFATTLAVVGLTGAAYWNLERTQAFGAARSHTLGRRGPAPKVDYAYLPITSQPNTTGEVRQTDDGRTLAHLPRANCSEVSSSSLLRLPDESLLLAWFCSKEGDKDMAIVVSKLRAGARTWDYPYEVSYEAGMTARNPVLWYDEDAKHVVLYHTSEISGTGQATAEVRMLTSPDYGDNFTYPETIFQKGFGLFVKHAPVRSKKHDGEILVPVYYTPNGAKQVKGQYSSLKWSRDGGRSWSPKGAEMSPAGSGIVEPCVVRPLDPKTRKPGDVLVAFFADRHGSDVYRSRSLDEGRTWSEPERTPLPNPNNPIAAAVLSSGNIAIVFNNRRGNAIKFPRQMGPGIDTGRRLLTRKRAKSKLDGDDSRLWPLSIAISEDGGGSFPYVRDLQASWHMALEYTSPSITQTADGRIHIAYTYSGKDAWTAHSPAQNRLCIRHVSIPGEDWVRLGAWTFSHDKSGGLATDRAIQMQVKHQGTMGLATQGEYRGRGIGANKKLDELAMQRHRKNKEEKHLLCSDRIGAFANSCDETRDESQERFATVVAQSILEKPASWEDRLNFPKQPRPDFKTGVIAGG